ncbi:hypothetical protein ACIPC1_37145 [Streptomyces sp. NPDC087263]
MTSRVQDVPGLRLLKVGDGWYLVRMPAEVGFPALALLQPGIPGTSLG